MVKLYEPTILNINVNYLSKNEKKKTIILQS